MDSVKYNQYVKKTAPKTKHATRLFAAFWVGGLICCIGQMFSDVFKAIFPTLIIDDIAGLTSMVMVFLGSLLTGLGVYDKIGRYAGGGSVVPITGFANSITSPAMEFHKEGLIFGLMSKMFVIAGPIIVSGIVASVGVGLIYYIVGLF